MNPFFCAIELVPGEIIGLAKPPVTNRYPITLCPQSFWGLSNLRSPVMSHHHLPRVTASWAFKTHFQWDFWSYYYYGDCLTQNGSMALGTHNWAHYFEDCLPEHSQAGSDPSSLLLDNCAIHHWIYFSLDSRQSKEGFFCLRSCLSPILSFSLP